MATKKTRTYLGNARLRPDGQNDCESITVSYTYQVGEPVVSGDVIKFCKIGENVQVLSVEIDNDSSLAASGTTVDVGTDSVADCFIDGFSFGNGAATARTVVDGLTADTAADAFADGHVLPSTSVRDIQATIGGSIGTAVTNTARTITCRIKYQYAYPNSTLLGVSDPRYPFSGSKVTGAPVIEDYNGNAP
jgi:hypothetical protein